MTENMQTDRNTPCFSGETNQPKGTKRKIVDADDEKTDLIESKRPNFQLNKDEKRLAHHAIRAMFVRILNFMGILWVKGKEGQKLNDDFKDVSMATAIANALLVTHTGLKQMTTNDTRGSAAKWMASNHKFVCHGGTEYTVPAKEMQIIVKSTFKSYGFAYTSGEKPDPNHWYGTVAPILTYATSFEIRRSELRTGHSQMPVS